MGNKSIEANKLYLVLREVCIDVVSKESLIF